MNKVLVQEHPALFLGEQRNDLVRIFAIDQDTGVRYNIRVKNSENNDECKEVLTVYPNETEYEITDNVSK